MTGYEDGKLLRMKGKVIPRKHDFAATVNYEMSAFNLNFDNFDNLDHGIFDLDT
jgi:hypothetical protein